MGTFVGPPVPERIQKLRNLKREQSKASVEEIAQHDDAAATVEPPPAEEEDGSSSEDDGDFGPQLPVGPASAEEEEAALARLHERSNDAGKETESALGSDRASWMSVALGGGSEREEITYNPKTFRRNISVKMDKSWTEKASDRSKRQADEMMGLNKRAAPTDDSQKKPKLHESKEAPPEDLRDHMPSLLDEHMAKRGAEQKNVKAEKGQGEGSFNWERDIQGKGRAANSQKVAAFVNQAKSMNDRFSRASGN